MMPFQEKAYQLDKSSTNLKTDDSVLRQYVLVNMTYNDL